MSQILNRMTTTAAAFVCLMAAAPIAVWAQTQDDLRAIIEAAIPAEIKGADSNQALLRNLLQPGLIGDQLSKTFDPRKALRAVDPFGNLKADANCFREKLPGNDPSAHNDDCVYSQGSATGQAPAAFLRFNLARGKISYLNRGRSFDAAKSTEAGQIGKQAAVEEAKRIAIAFGIPSGELNTTLADFRQLIAAAVPVTDVIGAAATGPSVMKVAEVHVRFQRKVGELPVFDSHVHVAMGDNGKGAPQTARFHGQWPDFKLMPGADPSTAFSRAEIVDMIVEQLADHTLPNTFARRTLIPQPGNSEMGTRAFLAYVAVGELHLCSDPGDEKGAPPATGGPGAQEPRPQDLARLYVPALVLWAVPKTPTQSAAEQMRKPPSTGIEQLSFPLFDISTTFCDGSV